MANPETPGTEQDPAVTLADDFSQTSRTLFAAGGGQATLAEVVRLAVATVEGCDFAGIFLRDGDTITTPVHTRGQSRRRGPVAASEASEGGAL